MKLLFKCFIVLLLILFAFTSQAKSLKDYIKDAKANQDSEKIAEAVKIMEKAVEEYPDSSSAYAYLGLYTAMQAGETKNFIRAGQLINESFQLLDTAVSLDSFNVIARLHRGIIGTEVPAFLGKLDNAINDLEFIIKIDQNSPDKIPNNLLVQVYNFLGKGYQKKGEEEKANTALKKVIELDPESSFAEEAKKQVKNIPETPNTTTKEKRNIESGDSKELMNRGKSYLKTKDCKKAVDVFKKLIEIDSKNVEAYTYLAQTLGCLAEKEHDENI